MIISMIIIEIARALKVVPLYYNLNDCRLGTVLKKKKEFRIYLLSVTIDLALWDSYSYGYCQIG